MSIVVHFDALAQASDFRIERRQVLFHCWIQNSNPESQTPNRQQSECRLTNRMSYRGSSENLNYIVRPYDQRAFSPLNPTAVWISHLALAIYMSIVYNFDALAQTSNRKETSCLTLLKAGFQPNETHTGTHTWIYRHVYIHIYIVVKGKEYSYDQITYWKQ